MIVSFRHKGLKRLFQHDDRSKLPPAMADRIAHILAALDDATIIGNMNIETFRLHPLKGDMKGYWAVTVRANWRIVFRFESGSAFDVDLIDYH